MKCSNLSKFKILILFPKIETIEHINPTIYTFLTAPFPKLDFMKLNVSYTQSSNWSEGTKIGMRVEDTFITVHHSSTTNLHLFDHA